MQNQYPLWKNLLLLGLFIFAIIYASPMLFGEDPAVQISATGQGQAQINSATIDQVKQILAAQNYKYKSIEKQGDDILVRFLDEETQLTARDVLKSSLGENYVVALNLASRTPKFLQFLGANPMKLGLDLRGGLNFLLEVDVNDMIKKREEGDMRTISSSLREAGVRYLSIEHIEPHGVVIIYRDADNLNRGYSELSQHLSDYTFTKITSNNQFKLQLVMSDSAIFKIADYAIDQTRNILTNRVNALGVSEAIVQRQGENHISVELPGIQDTARAKEILGKTATLRFQLVDTEHDAEAAAAGDVPLGSKLYDYEGRRILLKDQVILRGDAITFASATISQDGRPAVSIHLGGGGESMFNRVTSENVGKPLAVVYVETKSEQKMIDGKPETVSHLEERLISVATIQTALGANFEITNLNSEKYAQDLALLLRSGALVAPVTIVSELNVGPSMGKSNIHKGIISIIVGFLFVVIFMAFYYRVFGLIANIALFLNLIFVVAILSILGAVLTLPGMAGMMLAIASAVDANVLIYERIREELRNGMSPQASIYAGYERAFTTIVDANVATLIVAVVLYALGSGPVRGFAVVLTIGLMTSMLTAIVYTRSVVNFIYGRRNVKKLSIGL